MTLRQKLRWVRGVGFGLTGLGLVFGMGVIPGAMAFTGVLLLLATFRGLED